MPTKQEEAKQLEESLFGNEAGVADLLEFYAGIEIVYAEALKSLKEGQTALTSNSTNQER